MDLPPDVVEQLLSPFEEDLPPEVVQQLLEDFEIPRDVVEQLLEDFDDEPDIQQQQPNVQFGGNLNDHIDIGIQYRRRAERFQYQRAAHNVAFRDLDNIPNIPQFIVQVSVFAPIFVSYLQLFSAESFSSFS